MRNKLETIAWRPPSGYDLAVEVMSVADLRRRAPEAHFLEPQRVAFFLVLAVTRGVTTHVIDFTPHVSCARTWLLVRPGQSQRFDFGSTWGGHVAVFRPDFLPPGGWLIPSLEGVSTLLDEMPGQIDLPPRSHAECCARVLQMRRDAAIAASATRRNALLLHELQALLLRLAMASGAGRECTRTPATTLVATFRRLVEERFRSRRDVAWYASKVGSSERTLNRATQEVLDRSPKSVISERATLEAKRLLVHTRLTVHAVASELGFDEASNFVKYFKRETGCTPSGFRALYPGTGRDAS